MNKKVWLINAPQIAIIGFIVFNLLAMFTYPGGTLHDPFTLGYSFFNNFLSDLGRFNSWNQSPNFYSQLFFNLAMIKAGIVFSLYFFYLRSIFELHSGFLYWLSLVGTFSGIAGGLSMAGVGFTPSDLYFTMHINFAHWLFRFFFIASFCYTVIILKTNLIESKYVSGFFVFVIFILSYIIFSEFGPDARESIKTLGMQVVAQKAILLCFIIAVYIQTKGLQILLGNK